MKLWIKIGLAILIFVVTAYLLKLFVLQFLIRDDLNGYFHPLLADVISWLFAGTMAWLIDRLLWGKNKSLKLVIFVTILIAQPLLSFFLERNKWFHPGNGKPLKYYTANPLTGEISIFDHSTYDLFGRKAQPINPEISKRYFRQQNQEKFPNTEIAFEKINYFFDPYTGTAYIYYCKDHEGQYHYFVHPGYDPRSGKELAPVNSNIVEDDFKQRKARGEEAQKKKVEGERKHALKEERLKNEQEAIEKKKAKQEELRRKEEERQRLIQEKKKKEVEEAKARQEAKILAIEKAVEEKKRREREKRGKLIASNIFWQNGFLGPRSVLLNIREVNGISVYIGKRQFKMWKTLNGGNNRSPDYSNIVIIKPATHIPAYSNKRYQFHLDDLSLDVNPSREILEFVFSGQDTNGHECSFEIQWPQI